MPRLRPSLALCVIVAALSAEPSAASACGACASALAERYIPPVWAWSVIGVFWWLMNSLMLEGNPPSLGLFKARAASAIVPLVVAVAAAFMLGPLGFLLLLVGAAEQGVRTGWGSVDVSAQERTFSRRASVILLTIAAAALVFFSATATARDPYYFIKRYPGTSLSRSLIEDAAAAGDSVTLRRVLALADKSAESGVAAEALSRAGNRNEDVPLILLSLSRVERTPFAALLVDQHNAALERLLGSRPAVGKTAKHWEAHIKSLQEKGFFEPAPAVSF